MVEKIPVLFRVDKSGDFKGHVTAVFPTLPGGRWPEMVCYAHVGQHSACSPGWLRTTRPAEPHEFADLLAELKGIYEDPNAAPDRCELQIRQRITPAMRDILREAYR